MALLGVSMSHGADAHLDEDEAGRARAPPLVAGLGECGQDVYPEELR